MKYKLIVQTLGKDRDKKEFTKECDTLDEAIYWLGVHVGHTIGRRDVINVQIVKEE